MSRQEKDQLHLARINFLNLIGQSNPSDAWKLFCLVTPNITVEQVSEWGNLLKTEKVEVSDTASDDQEATPSDLTLTNIPLDVVEKIVSSIDIESEKNVRLTCKHLSQIVDTRDTLFNLLHIHLCSQRVGIEVHQVSKKKKTYPFNASPGVSHIENAVKKFEEVISMPNTKIKQLKIDWDSSEENRASYDELLKLLAVSLAEFAEKVHVEELAIHANAVDHLENVICSLKPGILKRLNLTGPPTYDDDKFDFSNVVILPQWKHLFSFICACCDLICPIQHLYHILHLDIDIASTSPIDISAYRDALIVSQGRIDHKITMSYNVDRAKQRLQPYTDCSGLTKLCGYYIRPDNKRLTFELNPEIDEIKFSTPLLSNF